jgi:sugar-phosphatase
MRTDTVIFDMDGLLIDSEPLWREAANELFLIYGKQLSTDQYAKTTGLRTKEFVAYWFRHFHLPAERAAEAEKMIVEVVIRLVKQKGKAMPGVAHIFNFFLERKYKIGLATSSPPALIEVVVDMLGIGKYLQAITSAENLAYGKPHPEVYLDCAAALGVNPVQCICFEDSFNGMIAAKAAKMKCVIIPSIHEAKKPAWEAADLKISTLANFNELLLERLAGD